MIRLVAEFERRTPFRVKLQLRPAAALEAMLTKPAAGHDAVFAMPATTDGTTRAADSRGARKVAWKYPTGEPVWAVPLTEHPAGTAFVQFAASPWGLP